MTLFELQSLAQLLTGRMLNSAAAGILLTGLVWAALRLIRRQNSGTRFAVWLMALVAVVSLPFLAGVGASANSAQLPLLAEHSFAIRLSGSWALYLFAAWAAGAALMLARLGAGLWKLHRLRSACSEVDAADLSPETVALLRGQPNSRPVTLLVSAEVAAPAVIGFLRPAVVFPERLLPQLSSAELEIVLLHELAHLRRRDQWSNLFQKILKALFFFHPAVWWIDSRLTLEREMACDDMVLAHRASPRTYASVLITLAEKLHSAPALALAQALVSRMRQMSLRVSQIMDRGQPRGGTKQKSVFSAGAALLALAVGMAPSIPNLVAFQPPAAPRLVDGPQPLQQISEANVPEATPRMKAAGQEPFVSERSALRRAAPEAALAAPRNVEPLSRSRRTATDGSTHANAAPAGAKLAAAYGAHNAAAPETSAPTPYSTAHPFPAVISQPAMAAPTTIVIVETTLVQDAASGEWIVRIWTIEADAHTEQPREPGVALEI